MELTPEERQRIYAEEKARLEIRRELEASVATIPASFAPVMTTTRPSNGTAAVLSLFIPGAGQIYKGCVGQGIAWLVFTVIGYCCFIVPGLILHLICIFSAHSLAAEDTGSPQRYAGYRCQRCKASVRPDMAHCPICGILLKCQKCQTRLGLDMVHCSSCGGSLKSEVARAAEKSDGKTSLQVQESKTLPLSAPRATNKNPIAWVTLAIAVVVVVVWSVSTSTEQTSTGTSAPAIRLFDISEQRSNQYRLVLDTYGKPERDDSTESDVPRPAIVTRILEYRPENVKLAFVPDAKLNEAPPYFSWKLMGAIDMNNNTKMSYTEAGERLRRRLGK